MNITYGVVITKCHTLIYSIDTGLQHLKKLFSSKLKLISCTCFTSQCERQTKIQLKYNWILLWQTRKN